MSIGDQLAKMVGITIKEGESPEDVAVEETTEEVAVDTKEVNEEQEEQVEVEEDPVDEEAEEATGEEEEETVSEETTEGEEEVDFSLKETNEALMKQNELLTAQLNEVLSPKEEVVEEKEEELPPFVVSSFVEDDDSFDNIMKDKESLNATLNKVAEHAYNKAVEQTLVSIPKIVTVSVEKEVANHMMAQEFFRAHNDLLPQRKFTAFVFRDLIAQNPDKPAQDILDKMLAPEVRRRLGTGSGKTLANTKKSTRPKFLNAGSGTGKKKAIAAPNSIASEISKMEKV